MTTGVKSPPSPERTRILIIGDWVIDTYQVVVPTQSDRSSHTGPSHNLVVDEPFAPQIGLCGAGHVARSLYKLREATAPYDLICAGLWHEQDEPLLKRLVAESPQPAGPAFTCAVPQELEIEGVELLRFNRANSTIVVERQFRSTASGLQIHSRTDRPYKHSPKRGDLQLPEGITHIVLHDLCKGAITQEIVETLAQLPGKPCWYIRTKQDPPKWRNTVLGLNVKLVFIGPERASAANPAEHWLERGRLTRRAFDQLAEYEGLGWTASNKPAIVLLTRKNEIIALTGETEAKCVTGTSFEPLDQINQIGFPSALFAGIVYEARDAPTITKELIIGAVNKTKWIVGQSPISDLKDRNWSDELADWRGALGPPSSGATQEISELGIISTENGHKLELWRACTDLPGYIACVDQKREAVIRIANRLQVFKRSGPTRRSLAIKLVADPGSGKTTLVKSLGRTFGFHCLDKNISELVRREQLIDFFDEISAAQARGEQDILVFIDECNAALEGALVYSLLLSPIEAERYVQNKGTQISLAPCAWIFAETPVEGETANSTEKLWDFDTRMSSTEDLSYRAILQRIEDNSSGLEGRVQGQRLEAQARLENVYLAATMIRLHHQQVTHITSDVLRHFRDDFDVEPSKPEDGARGHTASRLIRDEVAQLRNIVVRTVSRENWTIPFAAHETSGDPIRVYLHPGEAAD